MNFWVSIAEVKLSTNLIINPKISFVKDWVFRTTVKTRPQYPEVLVPGVMVTLWAIIIKAAIVYTGPNAVLRLCDSSCCKSKWTLNKFCNVMEDNNFFQSIFRSDNAQCLRNKPDVGKPHPKILPGKILSRDEQCSRTMPGTVSYKV